MSTIRDFTVYTNSRTCLGSTLKGKQNQYFSSEVLTIKTDLCTVCTYTLVCVWGGGGVLTIQEYLITQVLTKQVLLHLQLILSNLIYPIRPCVCVCVCVCACARTLVSLGCCHSGVGEHVFTQCASMLLSQHVHALYFTWGHLPYHFTIQMQHVCV